MNSYENSAFNIDISTYIKYIPHKADVPPIYLLIRHSHSNGSKYFLRCFYMMFALLLQFSLLVHFTTVYLLPNKGKQNGKS